MPGTSIFSQVTLPCPKAKACGKPQVCLILVSKSSIKILLAMTAMFLLNQIVTYALYILLSLSLHLGLEPVKLKVPFPLKRDQ